MSLLAWYIHRWRKTQVWIEVQHYCVYWVRKRINCAQSRIYTPSSSENRADTFRTLQEIFQVVETYPPQYRIKQSYMTTTCSHLKLIRFLPYQLCVSTLLYSSELMDNISTNFRFKFHYMKYTKNSIIQLKKMTTGQTKMMNIVTRHDYTLRKVRHWKGVVVNFTPMIYQSIHVFGIVLAIRGSFVIVQTFEKWRISTRVMKHTIDMPIYVNMLHEGAWNYRICVNLNCPFNRLKLNTSWVTVQPISSWQLDEINLNNLVQRSDDWQRLFNNSGGQNGLGYRFHRQRTNKGLVRTATYYVYIECEERLSVFSLEPKRILVAKI